MLNLPPRARDGRAAATPPRRAAPRFGGAGEFRGGLGVIREYEVLADALVHAPGERHFSAAPGLAGASHALGAHSVIVRADGARGHSIEGFDGADRGDRVIVETPGGGGYGDPKNRVASVRLRERKVSAEAARKLYGAEIVDPCFTDLEFASLITFDQISFPLNDAASASGVLATGSTPSRESRSFTSAAP